MAIETVLKMLEADRLSVEQQDALVEALLGLDRMGHPERRYGIVSRLGVPVSSAVPWSAVAIDHVNHIVRTCCEYPVGLPRLREALHLFYVLGQGEDLAPPVQLPRGLWGVPRRITGFAGREAAIEELHRRLSEGGAAGLTQQIAGMGGVGKTSVAIEYAHRFEEAYSAVLWFNAADLSGAFGELGREFRTPGWDAELEEDRRRGALRWLVEGARAAEERPWLLIYDNVTDRETVEAHVPPSFAGRVLYTARENDLLPPDSVVELDMLTEAEALDLFRKATGAALEDPAEMAAAQELAGELGRLPLALAQAAAYISSRNLKSSFVEYLAAYKKRRLSLLDRKRVPSYKETVATTWVINFEHIEKAAPATAELLRCCALLAPDGIPAELFLDHAYCYHEPLQARLDAIEDELDWKELLEPAARLGLWRISEEDENKWSSVSMHVLVQEAIQDRLVRENRLIDVLEGLIEALTAVFADEDYSMRTLRERYLVHVIVCAGIASSIDISQESAARLLRRGAVFLRENGNFMRAERLYAKVAEIYRIALKRHDPLLAYSLNDLAFINKILGRYRDAEDLYNESLAILRQALPNVHSAFAETFGHLADLYISQGRYSDAEPLLVDSLVIRKATMPYGHLDIATSLDFLAHLYRIQARYSEAEPLSLEALQISRATLPEGHPRIAIALNNLGLLYWAEGRYLEAEPVFIEGLQLMRTARPEGHPQIADCLNNLALVYEGQGRYAEAEPLLDEALQISRNALPEKHPDVATRLNNLGLVYKMQGRYSAAEPLYNEALQIRRDELACGHLDTAVSLNNLAALYMCQERDEEAQPLFAEALRIRQSALPKGHIHIAESLWSMATVRTRLGASEDAEAHWLEAITIYRKTLGDDHPTTVQIQAGFAVFKNHVSG